jgi:formate dehydrogenase subunit delta
MSDADNRLVKMANQMASYFKVFPEAQAITGLAEHINKFWDPRMRREILALAAAGAIGFEPLVTKAIPKVKPPKAN